MISGITAAFGQVFPDGSRDERSVVDSGQQEGVMTMVRGVLASLVGIACMSLAVAGSQGNHASSAAYKAPRTSFGQPDLEGVWSNDSATPLQRPAAWADKELLTPAELEHVQEAARLLERDGDALFGDELIADALLGKTASQSHDTETGNYNGFWLPPRDFERRTSLIIDPPNGRIPPTTAEARQRQAALAERRQLHPADGPESRGLTERCITFGVPQFRAAYSSVYQIVQSPSHVVFDMETIHDARVIPIDGRPHLSEHIPQWLGDSRGRWDGDTLVVDTTGFSPKNNFFGSSSGLHLVERFTRIAADTLQYDASTSRCWSTRATKGTSGCSGFSREHVTPRRSARGQAGRRSCGLRHRSA
jgi:hypothetical protein